MKCYSFQLATFVGLVATVSAHQCDSGGRVSCIAVKPLPADAQQSSHGKGARGTAHCTTDNKKVYCLANHDYHRCGAGQQACCSDGSNPYHWKGQDHNDAANEALTCGATSPAARTQATPSQVTPAPIVLDDMDTTLNSQMVNAYEGSYAPCMEDAYMKQFHHDWANNKGQASFSYTFVAPRKGCYSIEEYHPGSQWACARYLPTNAKVEVQYGQSQTQTFVFNQAKNPAQWNKLGSLMFSPDSPGKLTMRNSPDEQCADGRCFWVADAFRLTWTGEQCGSAAQMSGAQTKALNSGASTQASPNPPTEMTMKQTPASGAQSQVEKWGKLMLHAHASDAGGHSHADVTVKLKQHQNVFETTLAAHFSFKSVEVFLISEAGRRLSETGSVAVTFIGKGEPATASVQGLGSALQKALSAANAGLTISEATVEWIAAPSPSTQDVDAPSKNLGRFVGVVVGIGVLLTVVAGCACAWCIVQRRKQKVEVVDNHTDAAELGRATNEDVVKGSTVEDDKDMGDNVSQGSTRSPVSDPEDAISAEGVEGQCELISVDAGDNAPEASATVVGV